MKSLGLFAALFAVTMLVGCPPPPPPPPPVPDLCMKSIDCATPPEDRDWVCDEEGASAEATFSAAGTTFDYSVSGIAPSANEEYELVYAPDPWSLTQTDLICLGSTTSAVDSAEFSMSGSVFIGHDLPIDEDTNEGAKIWLVKKSNVDCDSETARFPTWDCAEILFENYLITYTYEAPALTESIDLCEKEVATSGNCKEGGAAAVLTYAPSGPDFSFSLEGTAPLVSTNYVVIYLPDYDPNPWPKPVTCLSDPILTGSGGEISVARSDIDLGGDLPILADINAGAKMWVVPATAVTCSTGALTGVWPQPYNLYDAVDGDDWVVYTDMDD